MTFPAFPWTPIVAAPAVSSKSMPGRIAPVPVLFLTIGMPSRVIVCSAICSVLRSVSPWGSDYLRSTSFGIGGAVFGS